MAAQILFGVIPLAGSTEIACVVKYFMTHLFCSIKVHFSAISRVYLINNPRTKWRVSSITVSIGSCHAQVNDHQPALYNSIETVHIKRS